MKNRSENNRVYKSFEQFKAELFPQLTSEEMRVSSKLTSKQVGACLADEAIDALLRDRARARSQ